MLKKGVPVCSPTRVFLAGLCLLACAVLPGSASGKAFIDYFKPTPVACPPTSSTWGDKAVLPRDTCNGLEDATGTATVKPKWMYWDGKILRAADGKYHMFADRWPHANGMGDWVNSETVHATSNALLGPYVDQGYAFNDGPDSKNPHKGHNVTASELPDGTYCLIVDETVPFTIFTADSPAGPWKNRGHAQIDTNGVSINIPQPGDQHLESNISFVVRPDGNYEIIQRHGIIAISTTGLLGPYKVQKPTTTYPAAQAPPSNLATIFPNRPKHLSSLAPQTPESVYVYAEDPVIWYSGGQFHVLYNYPDDRVTYHLTSVDGVHDWTDQGLAFDPREGQKIFTDAEGNINRWYNVERPNVIMENGHVAYFTFAVSDVFKMGISGNSNNDTKVVVVAFDGVRFDQETGIAGADGGASGIGGAGGRAGTDGGVGGGSGRDAAATESGTARGGADGSMGGGLGDGGRSVVSGVGGRGGLGGAATGGAVGGQGYGGSSNRGGADGSGGTSNSGSKPSGGAGAGGAGTGGGGVGGSISGAHGGSGVAAGGSSGCACRLGGQRGREERRPPGGVAAALLALAFLLWASGARRAPADPGYRQTSSMAGRGS